MHLRPTVRDLAAAIHDGVRDVLRDELPLVPVIDADIAGIAGQVVLKSLVFSGR